MADEQTCEVKYYVRHYVHDVSRSTLVFRRLVAIMRQMYFLLCYFILTRILK
jgi:hypothetical protein